MAKLAGITVPVSIDTTEIEKATEKIKELINLLEQAKQLLSEIQL